MSTPTGFSAFDRVESDELVAIRIDYQADSLDPGRVFRAMSGLIDAIHLIDVHLARSIHASVEPTLLLQAIETGSLRSVMRRVVRFIEPDVVIDDHPEPRVFRYLSQGANRILEFIDGHETVDTPEQIRELQAELVSLAETTGVAVFPSYEPVPAPRLLDDMQRVAEATTNLKGDDSAVFASAAGVVPISRSFGLTSERIEDLLTAETIKQTPVRVLVVKKPDYLGSSMWQFRQANRNIEAKILDEEWLDDFQKRRVDLRPGDAIRAEVSEQIKLDAHGNVVAEHYAVLRVLNVIPIDRFEQGNFLEEIQ